ncbi:MAG: hypothetical protein FJ044_05545, partial [Candidatus Cloacimonetes bacterium]|nr:hypothetical protein [Candidatus Cloacimonadota bacterium]
MKRVLLPLIIFSIFGVALAPSALPTSAQIGFEHQLILDMDAKVVVNLPHATEMCGGTLSLYSPFQKELLSFPSTAVNLTAEIGTFAKGTEIILSFTPEPNTPCPEQTILSGDPNHFFVLKITSVYWYAEWEIPGTPTGFALKFYLTPAQISKHHPAIFIHGLGGYPTDWTTGDKRVYFDTLKAEPYNYPEDYLATYAYADADGNPDTYDYQGDVTKISADLETYVNALSQKHLADGGDGKVDLVGFSLGGIVAREYLNTHRGNHKIRKLITIGSPHQGVYLMSFESIFNAIPIFGEHLRNAFVDFVNNTLLAYLGLASGQPVDINAPAPQQLIPGSWFLQKLNDLSIIPTEPSYNTVYGNIDARLKQRMVPSP